MWTSIIGLGVSAAAFGIGKNKNRSERQQVHSKYDEQYSKRRKSPKCQFGRIG